MSRALSPTGSMAVWAVTGPVGAGKSAVTAILSRWGAAIIDGDRLGHEVLGQPAVQTAICREFGGQYVSAGAVNRRLLGERVFNDPSALAKLNSLTHPALSDLAAAELESLSRAGKHQLAVFEAAVYFLLPSPPPVDLVIVVTAPKDLRRQRLQNRGPGGLSPEAVEARIAAQEPMAGLWAQADEIIVNDGSLDELESRTMRLLDRLAPGSENLP